MNSDNSSKIAILGCGISGMLFALSLAKAGIRSEIFELKNEQYISNPVDPRTTALSSSSKSFMENIGVWEHIEKFVEPINDIYVCDKMSEHILHIDSSKQELGIMICNSDLRKTLYQIVRDSSLITVSFGVNYTNLSPSSENGVCFVVGQRKVQSDICIVAEGKYSSAKEQFFSSVIDKDYKQKAIVFNISHSKHHEGGAIEHFLFRGPFATLPLKGGYASSIVWSEESEVADFLVLQENHVLENLMQNFIGGALGDVKIITKPQSYPLSAFTSNKYHHGMLALIADSAHSMHPLAGQGLNMGIKDVEYLSNLIIQRISLGIKPDLIMLDEYERARRRDNVAMVKITDAINSIFNIQIQPINKITQIGMSLLDKMPYMKSIVTDYARGRRYTKSHF